jgi:uncharacterized protein (DUF111 family)
MVKSKAIPILVEPEFHELLKRKSKETGVPLSEVARRAWKVWIETGELPKLPQKGGKHKTK